MMDILKNMDWATIFGNVVTVGLLLWAVIKLYAKTYIEEKVKKGFATALEEFKSDLEKKNIAYGVDYSFYNTERSKACLELYKKLYDFYSNALKLVEGLYTNIRFEEGSTVETRYLQYEQSRKELDDCYFRSKIFLDDDVCDQIKEFRKKVIKYCNDSRDLIGLYKDEQIRIQSLPKESKIADEMYSMYKSDFAIIVESFKKLIQPE